MMLRGIKLSSSSPSPHRSSLATALLLAALLLTTTFAWLFLLLSSRHSSCTPPSSFPSPFPWQAPDWADLNDPRITLPSSTTTRPSSFARRPSNDTHLFLRNLVFCIAGSARLWPQRKEFIKLWWKPRHMRGFVWLDAPLPPRQLQADDQLMLPMVIVSEDTSYFRYTHPLGSPSGIRIARILVETFRLGLPDVHWFVMGDDDTIFSTDNLLRVLSKYDPNEMYYIGGSSESHFENFVFSYSMAYGGGGVAISYPLAEALVGMLDECIQRYPHLFGSDDRLHACITELGVPITKEPGFHQFDIRGSAFGLMAAHPVAPFISMHHVDTVAPVFPGLGTLDGLRLLVKAMQTEPGSFLQQSICYQPKQKLSFSVSLGYTVQVFPRVVSPRELQKPEKTFKAWNGLDLEGEFDINIRSPATYVCDQPFVFFLDEIHLEEGTGVVMSTYKRHSAVDDLKKKAFCWSRMFSPEQVQWIRVVNKALDGHWYLIPRRQCCTLGGITKEVMDVTVESCQHGPVISS